MNLNDSSGARENVQSGHPTKEDMGAGASASAESGRIQIGYSRSAARKRSREISPLFEALPALTIADLLDSIRRGEVDDGNLVSLLGHVETLEDRDVLKTPFHETACVACEVIGATALWKPISLQELYKASRSGIDVLRSPSYHSYSNVFRASCGVDFTLREPPASCLIESPDGIYRHIVTQEGESVRIVLPAGATDWRPTRCSHTWSTWLGHRQCSDLRFDPGRGVLIGSQWEMDFPTARLVSPGSVAPRGRSFWNQHCTRWTARAERWNALVNQVDRHGQGAPCWMRNVKVTERTLQEGDACNVIGEIRRTATGAVEIHAAQQGLLMTNDRGAAKSLAPRRSQPDARQGGSPSVFSSRQPTGSGLSAEA